MEHYVILYNWDAVALIHYTLSGLKGNAKLWKNSINRQDRDWDDWKVLLCQNFPNVRDEVSVYLEAQNYCRCPNQNVTDYYYKKVAMLNKAGFPEHTHVGWIARGLNNVEYLKYLGPLTNYESAPELLQNLVTK